MRTSTISPVCRVCKVLLNSENFNEDVRMHTGLICRECYLKKGKDWRDAHPLEMHAMYKKSRFKYKEKNRERNYLHLYGISIQGYNTLFLKQDGKCAICGISEMIGKKNKHFCIDHDHNKSSIRGLLCDNCNKGLGNFKDSIFSLQKAIHYLNGGE